jgi:6-phosphofructokinase
METFEVLRFTRPVCVGGDGTLAIAQQAMSWGALVGIPKTIDNDLAATQVTFGFHSAVNCAVGRSTGCIQPPRATTGSWSWKSWVAMPAG